jgi:hypothetical protein
MKQIAYESLNLEGKTEREIRSLMGKNKFVN